MKSILNAIHSQTKKYNRTWAAFYSDCQKPMKSNCQINDIPWEIFVKHQNSLHSCRSTKKIKTTLLCISINWYQITAYKPFPDSKSPPKQARSPGEAEGRAPGSGGAGPTGRCAARAGSCAPRTPCSATASRTALGRLSRGTENNIQQRRTTQHPHPGRPRAPHLPFHGRQVALEPEPQVVSRFHQVLRGANENLVHGTCCRPRGSHDGIGLRRAEGVTRREENTAAWGGFSTRHSSPGSWSSDGLKLHELQHRYRPSATGTRPLNKRLLHV